MAEYDEMRGELDNPSGMTEEKIKGLYKSVFGDAYGRIVFEDILFELHFMQEANTEGEIALRNYAIQLINLVEGPEIKTGRFRKLLKKLIMRKKR